MPSVSFRDISAIRNNLAPSQLVVLAFPNHNFRLVRDFLARDLLKADNGKEVGSMNYISHSPKIFFKAKAFTSSSYLLDFNNGTPEYIRPQVFTDYNLKKGDVLISKDSNIGEVVILDKDYPDAMPSGAIYKLPFGENKYYALAFMKSKFVKDQLDTMVPKGATIRHAKTLFLDCKIPIPNQSNSREVIAYVQQLIRLIISKEIAIQKKRTAIKEAIENELKLKDDGAFTYNTTKFSDLMSEKRLDTGLYGENYQKISSRITNYSNGHKTLKELDYSIVRGQNLQVSNIGRSIYSNEPVSNFYKLVLSKDFTEWMTHKRNTYIGNAKKLRTIKKGDIIFSCRGDLGRVIVFCEDSSGYITNIDNVHIRNTSASMSDNVFIGLFLLHLRDLGFLSNIAITGSGADSFTKYQFDYVSIPSFPVKIKEKVAQEFYNPKIEPTYSGDGETLINEHEAWGEEVGIYEIDKSIKSIQLHLDSVLYKITNNEPVDIDFSF